MRTADQAASSQSGDPNIKISDQIDSSAKIIAGVNLTEKKINSPWKIDSKKWKSYIDEVTTDKS